MFWILALIFGTALYLEHYHKLFSKFIKSVDSGIISVILISLFSISLLGQAVSGFVPAILFIVILFGIAYREYKKKPETD
jgi:Na+/H+-dicarboxylate symporter